MRTTATIIATLVLLAAAWPAAADPIIEVLPPEVWGQPDEDLGLAEGTVEDFEDTSLIEGLFVEISDAEGNFSGIGSAVLPDIFDPVNGDPYGDSFAEGVWDGSHVLVNTVTNQSQYYGSPDWRPVAFYVPAGASWIALAGQQITVNHILHVNGQPLQRLGSYGFAIGTGPNGVLIVRASESEAPIVSVSFGGRGDAFVVDHVVVGPAETVSLEQTTWEGLKAAFR